MNKCPVCQNVEGGEFRPVRSDQATHYECDICGKYTMCADPFHQLDTAHGDLGPWGLTAIQRAVLSHRIRTYSAKPRKTEEELFCITAGVLDRVRGVATLPSPAVQAMNLVRLIGDAESGSGSPIPRFPLELQATIGAFDRDKAIQLAQELKEKEVVRTHGPDTWFRQADDSKPHRSEPTKISLSLAGWEQYEAERRGQMSGQDGFLALKFNEPDLDDFVKDVLKPTVEENFGCNLYDMRDVSQAGVIDNIMRVRIRDARFVIAELSHGNQGVYWEAGFAEGLGKPVVYICEASKFKEIHFDANHCTTVKWSADESEKFKRELVATLRRSLEEQ